MRLSQHGLSLSLHSDLWGDRPSQAYQRSNECWLPVKMGKVNRKQGPQRSPLICLLNIYVVCVCIYVSYDSLRQGNNLSSLSLMFWKWLVTSHQLLVLFLMESVSLMAMWPLLLFSNYNILFAWVPLSVISKFYFPLHVSLGVSCRSYWLLKTSPEEVFWTEGNDHQAVKT